MSHVNPGYAAVLEGKDPVLPLYDGKTPDPHLIKMHRVEAAWAKAHDIAEERFGQASVFFGEHGAALVKAMEAAPVGATAADLVKMAEAAIDKVKPKAATPASPTTSKPADHPAVPHPAVPAAEPKPAP